MKRLFFFLLTVLLVAAAFAQSHEERVKSKYQAKYFAKSRASVATSTRYVSPEERMQSPAYKKFELSKEEKKQWKRQARQAGWGSRTNDDYILYGRGNGLFHYVRREFSSRFHRGSNWGFYDRSLDPDINPWANPYWSPNFNRYNPDRNNRSRR